MAVPIAWKKCKAGDSNTEIKPNVDCYIEMDLCLFFLPHTLNPSNYKRHKCNHPFELKIGKVFPFFPPLQNLGFALMRRRTAHLQHAAVPSSPEKSSMFWRTIMFTNAISEPLPFKELLLVFLSDLWILKWHYQCKFSLCQFLSFSLLTAAGSLTT